MYIRFSSSYPCVLLGRVSVVSSSAPPHSAELFVQVGPALSPTCSKHGAPMLPTFNLRGRFVFFEKCFVLLQMVHFQHALAWFRLKRRYALLFSFFFLFQIVSVCIRVLFFSCFVKFCLNIFNFILLVLNLSRTSAVRCLRGERYFPFFCLFQFANFDFAAFARIEDLFCLISFDFTPSNY